VDIDSLCSYVYLVLFDYHRFELDPRAITIIHFVETRHKVFSSKAIKRIMVMTRD